MKEPPLFYVPLSTFSKQVQWSNHPQPPEYYYTFHRMLEALQRKPDVDRRLVTLQKSASAVIETSNGIATPISEFLDSPQFAATTLSTACFSVFEGCKDKRTTCRHLDILAYGHEIGNMSDDVAKLLT